MADPVGKQSRHAADLIAGGIETNPAFSFSLQRAGIWLTRGRFDHLVEIPDSAIDSMELHGTVNPLPEVLVFDRRHFTKSFPAPIVVSPEIQAVS